MNMQGKRSMRSGNRLMAAVLIIVGLGLAACSQASADGDTTSNTEPAHVEAIEGTELSRVILTEKANDRLGVETGQVREEQIDGAQRLVIPYSSVLYDASGTTWTVTSPEPLVFVRHQITIDRIEGDLAILAEGPPSGTTVVTVGVAEIYGTELGVGH
jgi:hypothetical protein